MNLPKFLKHYLCKIFIMPRFCSCSLMYNTTLDVSLTLGRCSNSGPNTRSTINRIDDDTNATAYEKGNTNCIFHIHTYTCASKITH